jgi:hypothetical protein
MNMMIGFGSTEEAFEAAEEKAFEEFVADCAREHCPDYFTKEFHEIVSAWLADRAQAFKTVAEAHDKAENAPSRYSYYYPYLMDDANYALAVVKFMHVNRRHALSPDGWALMQSERIFKVRHMDLPRTPQESASE